MSEDSVKVTGTYREVYEYMFQTFVPRSEAVISKGNQSLLTPDSQARITRDLLRQDILRFNQSVEDYWISTYRILEDQIETEKNSGRDPVGDYTFVWIKDGDEIYGHLEYPQGGVVPKSGGFWRTGDPYIARMMANDIFVDPFEVEPEED